MDDWGGRRHRAAGWRLSEPQAAPRHPAGAGRRRLHVARRAVPAPRGREGRASERGEWHQRSERRPDQGAPHPSVVVGGHVDARTGHRVPARRALAGSADRRAAARRHRARDHHAAERADLRTLTHQAVDHSDRVLCGRDLPLRLLRRHLRDREGDRRHRALHDPGDPARRHHRARGLLARPPSPHARALLRHRRGYPLRLRRDSRESRDQPDRSRQLRVDHGDLRDRPDRRGRPRTAPALPTS